MPSGVLGPSGSAGGADAAALLGAAPGAPAFMCAREKVGLASPGGAPPKAAFLAFADVGLCAPGRPPDA